LTDEEKTRAQAMINALSQQRAQSADQAVMLAADLAVAQATIAARDARIAELEDKLARAMECEAV